jgi:transposase InsO family protein
VARNKLARGFSTPLADRVWVADITYVGTKEGWLYLAAVMDLYSRRIVGWCMESHMREQLVLRALEMAVESRRPGKDLLHHSDRGSQYAAEAYQAYLARQGMECSMSGKGDCWDNAVMESFFHTLKVECVYQGRYETRAEARSDVFEYIEGFYNTRRLHSSLGYVSPAAFEAGQQAVT